MTHCLEIILSFQTHYNIINDFKKILANNLIHTIIILDGLFTLDKNAYPIHKLNYKLNQRNPNIASKTNPSYDSFETFSSKFN